MDELTTRTPETIAAEIRAFTASMLGNIIEIGRRMCEVKEMLDHGEFMPWIEANTGYSQSTANNFMRLFREYGEKQGSLFGAEVANSQTFGNLTYSKALKLLALPEGEREEFVESHAVDEMTARELEQAIRERDALKEQVETLEKHNTELETKALDYSNENDDLKERVKELESRPVDVAVETDEAAVQKAADEARAAADAEWRKKLKAAEDKLAKAKEKAKSGAAEQELEEAKAEAERLRKELDDAKREQAAATVAGDADLALIQEYAGQIVSCANKLAELRRKAQESGNDKAAEVARKALASLAEQIGRCAA